MTTKQATPFFVDKLTRLAEHLQRSLGSAKSNIERFIVARDQAYFNTAFFSGDRPSDLGQVKTPEILRFPNDYGLLFNHIWGKTLRDGDKNVFGILRNPQTAICPIRGYCIWMSRDKLALTLLPAIFSALRPTDNGGRDAPLSSATAEARLKLYLKEMKADEGETLHGFRSGFTITLALTGADLSEIMEHIGWARRHTVLYYLQLAKVLNPSGASARLAEAPLNEAATPWKDTNELKRFVFAFPSGTSQKRSHPVGE